MKSQISNLHIEAGDIVSIRTAGGGGYGDPRCRPAEAVREDVVREYVSPDRAASTYGVTVDPETGEIEETAPDRDEDADSAATGGLDTDD